MQGMAGEIDSQGQSNLLKESSLSPKRWMWYKKNKTNITEDVDTVYINCNEALNL